MEVELSLLQLAAGGEVGPATQHRNSGMDHLGLKQLI